MVRLYLLGKKGLKSLTDLHPKYLSKISNIVIGQDAKVINDYSNEIIRQANKHGIPFCFRNQELEAKEVDLIVAIGWRWLIDDTENLIVFHDSLLPKYRGFNPLVTALNNGDTIIGATAIMAREKFDTGPIVRQKSISIDYPIKIETAIELMANLYSNLLNDTMKDYIESGFKLIKQEEKLASYSLWRDEDDYIINWNNTSEQIQRFIHATGYPYKGAKTKYKSNWLRVFDAVLEDDIEITNRTPGKVIFHSNNRFVIVCGKGLIGITEFYDDKGNTIDFKKKLRLRFGS